MLAFQIRALRDGAKMSQAEFANALGTSQPAINRLESTEKARPTITTLKKIAAVFDVGLEVRFVPFSTLAKFVSGTPFVEYGMSTSAFYVPPFEKDENFVVHPERPLASNVLSFNQFGGQKRKEPRSEYQQLQQSREVIGGV
jgi:transcriptional regulator with XRE-family HTH domain